MEVFHNKIFEKGNLQSRGRPRIKCLISLSTWMAEHVPEGQRRGMKEQELQKRTKERKLWKAMINHILKGHGK